jgi:hypothetical protein
MAEILITFVFIAGYTAIAFEHKIQINKVASALIAGVLSWVILIFFSTLKDVVSEMMIKHLGDIAAVLFFLLSAMTIKTLQYEKSIILFISSNDFFHCFMLP